jgi:hypothetical protein
MMANTKRRKRKGRRVIAGLAERSSSQKDKNDLIIARRLARINSFIGILILLPGAYGFYDAIYRDSMVVRVSGRLFYVCVADALVLFVIGRLLDSFGKRFLKNPLDPTGDVAKYRKLGVWQIAISIFIVFLAVLPIIYANGYIARLSNLLPGKEQLGNKLSLGAAFGLGAILSGVLGNFAYDALKFVVRKMMERKK